MDSSCSIVEILLFKFTVKPLATLLQRTGLIVCMEPLAKCGHVWGLEEVSILESYPDFNVEIALRRN